MVISLDQAQKRSLPTELPAASALICTRNRGPSIATTIRSLLANTTPTFELIVIDQSTDDRTEEAIMPFLADERLIYHRLTTTGKGKALNYGMERARGEIVAITDDDCEVPCDWIARMLGLFADRPKLAVAFCNVEAAPHDPNVGFIPSYYRHGEVIMTHVGDRRHARGIGAGMAVRRSAVLDLGGFDEMLGPGSPFPSFDEVDIALRSLLRGWQVFETGAFGVVHYGFRTMDEGRDLVQRDCLAIGAGHAKLIKCGQLSVVSVCMFDFWLLVVGPAIGYLIRLRKPPVLKRGVSFIKGFARGMRTPVDRKRLLYRQS